LKVLLVFPPAEIAPLNIKNITPPLGIAYLGAVLEGAGHTVSLLDCQIEGYDNVTKQGWSQVRFGLSPDEIASRIAKESPGLIGVSCLFSSMAEQAKEVLRICKQATPQAHTVFGGLHPSLYPEDALSELSADIVFQGQGEDTFPTLVDALSRSDEVASIPGVHLGNRDPLATSSTGSPAHFLNNLDDLPFPAWHLLPMESYFAINFPHGNQVRSERVAPMLTSRGCPFKCGFCAAGLLWNGQFSYRSPESVVSEIEFLIDEYGVQEVHFEDDNLTMDRNRALALFRLMAERTPKMKWNAPGGISPTNLDDEVLEARLRAAAMK
jgi:anaerobic magnesium-protoporphyrin IX monomethyl ester cyclase